MIMTEIRQCNDISKVVSLPGYQRAGISRLLKENGREQFWPKKGQFASYKEKLEKLT
jgi:hypothetical protein